MVEIDNQLWQTEQLTWPSASVKGLLNIAQKTIESCVEDMRIRGRIIRKELAVGLVPGGKIGKLKYPSGSGSGKIRREILDEVALAVQTTLNQSDTTVPYCAFNGGNDVFVDIGNKRVGVQSLMAFFGIKPAETLHVGDQFLAQGNDFACRSACPTAWITSPNETKFLVKTVLRLSGIDPHEDLV